MSDEVLLKICSHCYQLLHLFKKMAVASMKNFVAVV